MLTLRDCTSQIPLTERLLRNCLHLCCLHHSSALSSARPENPPCGAFSSDAMHQEREEEMGRKKWTTSTTLGKGGNVSSLPGNRRKSPREPYGVDLFVLHAWPKIRSVRSFGQMGVGVESAVIGAQWGTFRQPEP